MRDVVVDGSWNYTGFVMIDNVETFVEVEFDDLCVDYGTLAACVGGLEPYESVAATPTAGQIRAFYDVFTAQDVMWGHLPRTLPEFMAASVLLGSIPELREAVRKNLAERR